MFRNFVFFAVFCLGALCSQAQQRSIQLIIGLNGSIPASDEMSSYFKYLWRHLRHYNIDSYRFKFDLKMNSSGDLADFEHFIGKLGKLKMTPVPIVELNNLTERFLSDYYFNNYTRGRNFCIRYGKYLNIVEVATDYYSNIAGETDSTSAVANTWADKKYAAGIKGFTDGVRSVDSTFIIAISLPVRRFQLLNLLEQYDIAYDIIDYHLRTAENDLTDTSNNVLDDLKFLKDSYQKPLWLTAFSLPSINNDNVLQQRQILIDQMRHIFYNDLVVSFFLDENADSEKFLRYKSKLDLKTKSKNWPINLSELAFHKER